MGLKKILIWKLAIAGILLFPMIDAQAVPSFARQTGLTCSVCHTVFPQLTAFGRNFKLQGYTLTNTKKGQTAFLGEDYFPPLSAMLQVSYTHLQKTLPGTQNSNVLFPDQFSIFYAGRVSDKVGAFLQATYEGTEDHLSMDNADVRFADQDTKGKRPVTYGLTINNNPTVQDVWNSTPVWGYPYASSSVAPAPMATAQIDGNLGQQVTGLTAYTLWNNMVYGEFGFYRSSQIGGVQPPDTSSENVLKGGAPYWRIAVQHNWGLHYLELGTYGIVANMYPGAGNPLSGSTNRYTDGALDAQYQIQMGQHTITAHSTWIWERQRLRAAYALMEAANPTDILRTFKIDGTYYNNRRYGGTLAFFTTGGSEDAGLYAPNPIDGSRTGKPDSTGWIAEMDYVPWSNTKLSLQYTMYTRFNGAGENYDGYGRAASDNNNLYLNVWLMY